MSHIEAWEELCEFYSYEPLFKKSAIPEHSIKKMVLVFFSQCVKAPLVNGVANDYLQQHQRLMRAQPMADPFDLQPNVIEVKKHGNKSLRDIIQAAYRTRHEYPESYRVAYINALKAELDWEPHMISVRTMIMTTRALLIIGEKNAQNFRNYFLEKYREDEPQVVIHKIAELIP